MYFPLNYFSNKYSNSHNFIIHLKISFLFHNKEKKSYSIFHFFFLPNFRIPTTPLPRRRIATNEATVRKKKEKKEGYARETYTNLNEPDPSAFRWIVSN